MSAITAQKSGPSVHTNIQKHTFFLKLRTFLLSWEVYIILFVAAFLRLYQFGTTEFDDDEAAVFNMAYNAVHHGYLVATSNIASIHIYNPPAIIYFFMIPAAFTNDPLWGAIMVGILMTISVMLTYVFVRHYYGRFTGTIAALLYATLFRAVLYSRFIWNQNLLPLFVILFIMMVFRGAVARKKGWFVPALLLLGLLIQLHGSGIFMLIPLALAILVAPETIRKRDIAIAIGALLLIYAPYVYWEAKVHLLDLHTLLHSQNQPATIDSLAWHFYQILLNPYNVLSDQNPQHWNVVPFLNQDSLLGHVSPYIGWISEGLPYIAIISMLVLLVLAIRNWMRATVSQEQGKHSTLGIITIYWQKLRNSPTSCGLLLLLLWQIPLLIVETRHGALYLHYFIILLPGPCILLAIFIKQVVFWLQQERMSYQLRFVGRYLVYALALLVIVAQFVGSTAGILDLNQGHYSDGSPVNNLYNDLRSLRAAVNEADQVAVQHHLSRVYISTDWPTQSTLRYLSTFMKTPATLFTSSTQTSDHDCIALPGASEGPAVMLIGPYSNFTDALVQRFTSAKLIDKPARSGGAPFRLYIVSSPKLQPIAQAKLGQDIQLLNTPAQTMTFNNSSYLVTRWNLLRSAAPSYRKIYGYNFVQSSNAQQNNTSQCNFTAMRAGDQILVPFTQTTSLPALTTTDISAVSYEVDPYYLHLGPLTFETYRDDTSPAQPLITATKNESISVPLAR